MRIVSTTLISAALASAGVLHADAGSTMNKASQNAQQMWFDVTEENVTTIDFAVGARTLSEAQRGTLRALVKSNNRRIDKAIVAAWSDKSFSTGTQMNDADEELAEARAEEVESFLDDDLDIDDVDTYTLAEQANWFQKLFHTDEAQVKKSIRGEGIDSQRQRQLASVLSSKGGPSRVVVILRRDHVDTAD